MSDRDLRAGLRTFISGGATFVESDTLKAVFSMARDVLTERGEKLPTTEKTHYYVPVGEDYDVDPVCGSYVGEKYDYIGDNDLGDPQYMVMPQSRDSRFTTIPSEVTCLGCRKTNRYKQDSNPGSLAEPSSPDSPVHYAGVGQTRVCGCTPYTYYPTSATLTRNPEEVTCKNCQRTRAYKRVVTAQKV